MQNAYHNLNDFSGRPIRTFNINAHFIASNPPTSFNPRSIYPRIHKTAFVGPFSSIIGDVSIGENVFIAPNVSIRADEGTPFHIGSNTNIQDGVILHGLEHGRVLHNGKEYSIYIANEVSCAHGCIIHGPCKLENRVFVGFHAIVLNAIVGEGSYISINALVTGGIRIAPNRFVPPGAIIETQEQADALGPVPADQEEFAEEVQHINQQFPPAYSLHFGSTRCSCGLACDCHTVKAILE